MHSQIRHPRCRISSQLRTYADPRDRHSRRRPILQTVYPAGLPTGPRSSSKFALAREVWIRRNRGRGPVNVMPRGEGPGGLLGVGRRAPGPGRGRRRVEKPLPPRLQPTVPDLGVPGRTEAD